MTWTYNNTPITEPPEGMIGFVYCITKTSSGKKYIGKKLFSFSKTTYKTVKLKNGNKKRKKTKGKIESDWKQYFGSSIHLTEDISNSGKDQFTREILYFCKSKSECSYVEAKLQFEFKVLESDNFYNNQISVRIHGSHIINKI